MNDSGWRGIAEDFRRLLAPSERERSRKYVLEGYRLHERAVRSGAGVETVLISQTAMADRSSRLAGLVDMFAAAGVQVVTAPDPIIHELTGGRGGGPLAGIASMPPPPDLADLPGEATVLVAADVEDPGNVGAMMRTALVSGCAGFVAAGISDPFHPKSVRTSMGSVFRIPVLRFENSREAVSALKSSGARCIGAVSRGGVPLDEALELWEGQRSALFLGGEARGLDEKLVDELDGTVTIPMADNVDSFSVNAAAAIVLYERFRGQQPKPG